MQCRLCGVNFVAFLLLWQRTAADQILRELQNNPDTWLQVVHILQNSHNLNTKFFALQVTCRVLLYEVKLSVGVNML